MCLLLLCRNFLGTSANSLLVGQEQAERAVTLQPKEEEGSLIKVYKSLKEACKEDGARLFLSVVLSDRTRGYEHKLKHRRFPLNIKKHNYGSD